jgi:predicted amidohydrolase YtcJ
MGSDSIWMMVAWGVDASAADPAADGLSQRADLRRRCPTEPKNGGRAGQENRLCRRRGGADLARLIGGETKVVDLGGRMLMPGLVDAHMHPLSGGLKLLACSLDYAALTIEQFRARIQTCLDRTREQEPDGWLEVESWFQQNMLPPGTVLSHADLDALDTQRPILVHSSFGHSTLANGRAMEVANITSATPDPEAGAIARDAAGQPTGIFEESAQGLFDDLLPGTTDAQRLSAAQASLEAMAAQGITTFLDASADAETVAAYAALQREGKLTARAHFAMEIRPQEGRNPDQAVDALLQVARQYDQGPITAQPTITVRGPSCIWTASSRRRPLPA